ncbi:hypothetical protein M8J77_023286 [Diaphorina citri]|nr:hypothetical protein M8J77_023286 [Diaphorina citri]
MFVLLEFEEDSGKLTEAVPESWIVSGNTQVLAEGQLFNQNQNDHLDNRVLHPDVPDQDHGNPSNTDNESQNLLDNIIQRPSNTIANALQCDTQLNTNQADQSVDKLISIELKQNEILEKLDMLQKTVNHLMTRREAASSSTELQDLLKKLPLKTPLDVEIFQDNLTDSGQRVLVRINYHKFYPKVSP